jgi:hypothetical protein
MSTPMTGAYFGNPALPVPAHPPLHRAVMDAHHLGYLFHAPVRPQQPQGMQASPHFPFPLLPISFPQGPWGILRLPPYLYPFS